MLLVFGLLSNNALSSTLGQSLLVPEPQSSSSSLADTTKPRLASYASNMKEAYVIGITAGPSFAVGDYRRRVTSGDGTGIGVSFRLDFSARIIEALAVRVEYGAFAHTNAQSNGAFFAGETRQTTSSGFLGIGPEIRLRVGQSSQVAAYATVSSTTTIFRTTFINSFTDVSREGSGYALGLLLRTPLDTRVSFLGNFEFRSLRTQNSTADINALNLNLGIGINFRR